MLVTILVIFAAAALFLIFRDDHDDSYTKGDRKTGRDNGQKSVYRKSVENRRNPAASNPRPAPVLNTGTSAPRYAPPAGKQDRPKKLDFHFLDRIDYDVNLPERTMSSFIAGVQGFCSNKDLGGVVGYVQKDPVTGTIDIRDPEDRLLGYLPMKDHAAFHAFNPTLVICPFAGHVAISMTGKLYADIRIVLPSTRDFVEESLTGFLG